MSSIFAWPFWAHEVPISHDFFNFQSLGEFPRKVSAPLGKRLLGSSMFVSPFRYPLAKSAPSWKHLVGTVWHEHPGRVSSAVVIVLSLPLQTQGLPGKSWVQLGLQCRLCKLQTTFASQTVCICLCLVLPGPQILATMVVCCPSPQTYRASEISVYQDFCRIQ